MTPPTATDAATDAADDAPTDAADDAATDAADDAPTDVPGEVQPPCEVLPGLWQSGLPDDWEQIRDLVDAVVDVADVGPGPTADDLGALTYVKAPLEDGEDLPDEVLLTHLTGLVADLVRQGRRVLVHCTFGKNRSGLLMSLIVRELLGCDGATALDRVRAVRDRAVNNEDFAAWLRGLPAPR